MKKLILICLTLSMFPVMIFSATNLGVSIQASHTADLLAEARYETHVSTLSAIDAVAYYNNKIAIFMKINYRNYLQNQPQYNVKMSTDFAQ